MKDGFFCLLINKTMFQFLIMHFLSHKKKLIFSRILKTCVAFICYPPLVDDGVKSTAGTLVNVCPQAYTTACKENIWNWDPLRKTLFRSAILTSSHSTWSHCLTLSLFHWKLLPVDFQQTRFQLLTLPITSHCSSSQRDIASGARGRWWQLPWRQTTLRGGGSCHGDGWCQSTLKPLI